MASNLVLQEFRSILYCQGENKSLKFYNFEIKNEGIEFKLKSKCILSNEETEHKVYVEFKYSTKIELKVLNSWNGNPWFAIFEPKQNKVSIFCIRDLESLISKTGKMLPIIINDLIQYSIPLQYPLGEFYVTREKDLISKNCIFRPIGKVQYESKPANMKHFLFNDQGDLIYIVANQTYFDVFDFFSKEKLYEIEMEGITFLNPYLVQIKKELHWLHFGKQKVNTTKLEDYSFSHCFLSSKNDALLKLDFDNAFCSKAPFACSIYDFKSSKTTSFILDASCTISNCYDLENQYFLFNYESCFMVIAKGLSFQIIPK